MQYVVVDPSTSFFELGPNREQIVNVFDRGVPQTLAQTNPVVRQLADALNERRQLEQYLLPVHYKSFSCRNYVLQRICRWAAVGIDNGYQYDYRERIDLPTDSHILECVMFRWLGNYVVGFPGHYVQSEGWTTMRFETVGRSGWLREKTFSLIPGGVDVNRAGGGRPAVHYDVCTVQRLWNIRSGNRNLWESILLFLQIAVRYRHDLVWNNADLQKICHVGQTTNRC